MKSFNQILLFILIVFTTLSCNTLYNSKYIEIEVVAPGKMKIPQDLKKVAVRYNNCNVSKHSFFGASYINGHPIEQVENIDSLASLVYFRYFVDEIEKQDFFDTVIILPPGDYSKIKVLDTINSPINTPDSLDNMQVQDIEKIYVKNFSESMFIIPNKYEFYNDSVYLHPETGLYTPSDLKEIADSTEADILISLDFFSSIDAIYSSKTSASESVLTQAYWNFFNLNEQKYYYSHNKIDTIYWSEQGDLPEDILNILPPPRDAVLNSADIAGTQFAYFLIPHWIKVERMYYGSGHVELQKTEDLINKGDWMEAAKIWKANSTNPNKNIAAKCKFNMALVCEMEGNLNAALEWVVDSYHTLGKKNQQHLDNCMKYINILSYRKQDIRRIEHQIN